MPFAFLAGQSAASKVLVTAMISMFPFIELRGAIPIGVSLGLNVWTAMLISIIANLIPVPFIILFIRRIFDWLSTKSGWWKKVIDKRSEKTLRYKDRLYKSVLVGLAVFVAIPLPGTGAWSGALLAALLDIRLKSAFPAISVGVVVAGFLVAGITHGFTAIFS